MFSAGSMEAVRILVESGADVNHRDASLWTAYWTDDEDRKNDVRDSSKSAIFYAAMNGNLKLSISSREMNIIILLLNFKINYD